MAPIDYFKTALYGEDESNSFLPDIADFFASYDDVARKLQAKRDQEQQEYKDLLAQAAQPRTTSTGELLSQALLSFGAPLLGKAVGGAQLGAQAGEMGLKASSNLSSEIDERYKLQQSEKAIRAKAAGERVDEFDKEILKLPLAKLDRQGQMTANRMQTEDAHKLAMIRQNDSQAFEKELTGIRHGQRLAEIGAVAQTGGGSSPFISEDDIQLLMGKGILPPGSEGKQIRSSVVAQLGPSARQNTARTGYVRPTAKQTEQIGQALAGYLTNNGIEKKLEALISDGKGGVRNIPMRVAAQQLDFTDESILQNQLIRNARQTASGTEAGVLSNQDIQAYVNSFAFRPTDTAESALTRIRQANQELKRKLFVGLQTKKAGGFNTEGFEAMLGVQIPDYFNSGAEASGPLSGLGSDIGSSLPGSDPMQRLKELLIQQQLQRE